MNAASSTSGPGPVVSAALSSGDARSLISPQASLSLVLSNFLLAGLFALMLWSATAHGSLTAWLIVAGIFAFAELSARLFFAVRARDQQAQRRWQRWIAALDVCIGLVWLYAAIFFFPTAHTNLQFFYLFSLAAPALCTAVYQHYHLPTCFARIGLALPVASAHLIQSSEFLGSIQAFIVVGIWGSIVWLALRLHRSLLHRLDLTRNRDALLEKVAEHARDLAALRSMEAASRVRAESANFAKSRFLAHSSHDLRQPLHAISLLLETVDDEQLDRPTGHVVARVRQSVELLAGLFDSLLDLTLLDTGQVEISEVTFDLDSVFKEVAADFSSLAQVNCVSLVVEPCRLHVLADSTIARRMIQNLVANAIRHTPNGTVTLRAHRHDKTLRVEIEDNGSGIAIADQERIFEEFTKLDAPASTDSAGSLGLGLAIVNRLALLSGVQVRVVSEPDRGSLFSIGPFDIRAAVDRSAAAQFMPVQDPGHLQVVVVDDDRDTLKATGGLLQKWGFAVTLLEEGNLQSMPCPNVLVCDYELAGQQTGIDVIRQVRERYNATLPALLISGNTSPELASRALSEDLRLLRKPVRPAQLKSAILTLLGTASTDTQASTVRNGE